MTLKGWESTGGHWKRKDGERAIVTRLVAFRVPCDCEVGLAWVARHEP